MGRPKYFRANIKDQINSLQYKSKYFYLKDVNISRYGLCLAEVELLAEIANDYYQNVLLEIPERSDFGAHCPACVSRHYLPTHQPLCYHNHRVVRY